MKKIFFIIAVLISSLAYSQGSQTTYTVTSIANMKTYSGQSSRIHVTATNEDFVNSPASTPDEVTIYDGAGTRVWKKVRDMSIAAGQITSGVISAARLPEFVLSSTYFSGAGTSGDPIVPIINTSPTDASVLPVTSNAVFDGLALKQATLVSGTNIKTVNGTTLLGSGDLVVGGSAAWGGITGTLSSQTDLQTALNLKANLATPVFTTNITTPLVIGGSTTTSPLTFKTTSGVGTTGADMHFLVGNNGGTEAMTILNNGSVGIGTNAPSAGYLFHLSSATATTQFRLTNTSGNFNYSANGTDFYYTNGTAGRHIFANGPGNFRFVVHTDGRIFGDAIHNNGGDLTGSTNQYIASGTYTPTLTNTTNVAASTAYLSQWIRVGNVITVTGKVDIDVTSAAATLMGLSLPIASNLATEQNLAGTANSAAAASLSAAIRADATNDRAAVVFTATSTTNDSYFFTFTYTVL